MRTIRWALIGALALIVAASMTSAASGGARDDGHDRGDHRGNVKHIVVIYEENHSFDNLYGSWEGVRGLNGADAAHTTQVDQFGNPYSCLLQDDANLALVSQGACAAPRGFPNNWFTIDPFIPSTATTCPPPLLAFVGQNGFVNGTGLPGGCTRDIVHRFYEEIYQLNGGRQNRYATGSDAAGLVMGVYDTRALPIYKYLHERHHPSYAIADNFFQGAFGGSFLNHQWLIAARTPDWPGIPAAQHSVLDANGMTFNAAHPERWPLYTPIGTVNDAAGTLACPTTTGLACGDFAVNTTEPQWEPTSPFAPKLPPQTNPTIGDRLTAKGVDWAWYAGGWSDANGNVGGPGWTNGTTSCTNPNVAGFAHFPFCPDNLFQQHHQPFNYYAAFDPSTPAGLANRTAHLKDETEFTGALGGSDKKCQLKPVSFVKPIGEENEHPGYASEPNGSDHLVSLLRAIEGSKCAKDTMVIVTYDEFGGQWDHVPPPGQGGTRGLHDIWGPGTRIPTLVISDDLDRSFSVDHTQYDTTSILATIEAQWRLQPLGTRDKAVSDLFRAFREDD